jgi:hypothetical protein
VLAKSTALCTVASIADVPPAAARVSSVYSTMMSIVPSLSAMAAGSPATGGAIS